MHTALDNEIQVRNSIDLASLLADHVTGAKVALLRKLEDVLKHAKALVPNFTEAQLAGRADGYSRDLLFSDPDGLFSMMLLTWRSGQHSPVHSHWTWCGYIVLKGELSEQIYRWEDGAPRIASQMKRRVGDVVVSDSGHADIHRLGNNGEEIALSLHIYGVDKERIATHINRVFKVD